MAEVRVVVVAPEELRALIAEAMQGVVPRAQQEEWIDARSSGLGRRLFLRLGREGAFPIFKRGRSYVARRCDLDAYIERQRVPFQPTPAPSPSPPPPPPDGAPFDPIAAALAEGRLRIVKKHP